MKEIEALVERVETVANGFGPIKLEAEEVVWGYSAGQCMETAGVLLGSPVYQARMLAVFILGMLAHDLDEALLLMKNRVSRDEDWRVQEILAQAFDRYCADGGYEACLPVMREWLADGHPNVRRAVSEGLRIWTAQPYFREHPEVAIKMLAALHGDDSKYVRKSAGNALRDISRKHALWLRGNYSGWT